MPETVAETTPQLTLDRRDFLVTKLTTGFALATLPISAATIATDTAGIDAEWFKKNGAA
jgi:hypothetical protein